jgi:hypothetical protein
MVKEYARYAAEWTEVTSEVVCKEGKTLEEGA